ncbi:golgin family A protein [Tasmannia lanceolata]|uniref:golgin family A protein n=1 Tax=Tasmannia lanceolata TaxID=3420 RepID=UPI004062F5A8
MAGLLAWAADVVGGGGQSNEEDDQNRFPIVVFTPEQQQYARELEQKAASLRRSIQDLRLRIPPPHISQRLPHLHAHSVASNAALALQLNAHSSTRQQAQLREVTLQEENTAYQKAISNCQKRIHEKFQEADPLQSKLKEMDLTEKRLRAELDETLATLEVSQSGESFDGSKITKGEVPADSDPSKSVMLEKLDDKKKELSSMEEIVQNLENKWAQIQHDSLRQPSPAQREKILEKQLQSLIEQLTAKQAQAEGLVTEIHVKEQELEKLNGLRRRLENGNMDGSTARIRFGRIGSVMGSASTDYIVEPHGRNVGGMAENQQRLMLLRSTFLLYIFALHVLVFIKISF